MHTRAHKSRQKESWVIFFDPSSCPYLVDLPTHFARATLGVVSHHVPLDHVGVLRHELAHVANTPRMVRLQKTQQLFIFKSD